MFECLGGDDMLNRETAEPLYVQIHNILVDRLDANQYKANTMIPSESALCQEFGVSRTTLRSVITQLVQAGRLYRIQGKGTFVAEPKITADSTQYVGIREQLEQQGYEVTYLKPDKTGHIAVDDLRAALRLFKLDAAEQRIVRAVFDLIEVLNPVVGKKRFRCAERRDPVAFDAHDFIGYFTGQINFVQAHDHRNPSIFRHIAENAEQFDFMADIQKRSRLVQDDDLRLLANCPCEQNPLPLSVADRGKIAVIQIGRMNARK